MWTELVMTRTPYEKLHEPKQKTGRRLKLLLWLKAIMKEFLDVPNAHLRVHYLKIYLKRGSYLKEIKEKNKIVMKALKTLKEAYAVDDERIEYAWVRIPNSDFYHAVLLYMEDAVGDTSGSKMSDANVFLLDNTYGRDYSVSYLCDPLVDYDKSYLISPTHGSISGALKFLKHLLEYVPPYVYCTTEKSAHKWVVRYVYDAKSPRFCGFSTKRKEAMRRAYAKLNIFDY